MNTLVIIPSFIRAPDEYNVTLGTLESLRDHEPLVEVLVVDDCSPAQGMLDELETHAGRLGFEIHRSEENQGFSRGVNVGLRRALEDGQDAVLMNADIETLMPWLDVFVNQKDSLGRPASVVGPQLLYPNGLIQSAGTYFSLLTRNFDHRYRYGPGALPEAKLPYVCPVTAAFQFIRHECLQSVGLYSESYRMGYEDVDHSLRVFESGRECIYQPGVVALHHESLFRGRADQKLTDWQNESLQTLMTTHQHCNMARYVPPLV